jgi:parallel beta-helix repeat protein
MAVNLSPLGGAGWQFFDNNGIPLAGGLLYAYSAGTTTPITTYTSSSGSIANSNPIVLDSTGRLASEIWITAGNSVKFVLQTSDAIQIGSYDNISGINDFSSFAASTGSSLIGYNQGTSGAVTTTVQARLQQTISIKDFGAACNGTTDDTTAVQLAISSLGSTNVSLFIPGPTKISSSVTFNANTQLNFQLGGSIVGTSGTEVVTVQRQPVAGLGKIFSNCLAIATTGMTVYPEWFGAVKDGSTNDQPAFTSAIYFLQNVGGIIQLQAGNYAVTSAISVAYNKITIQGAGNNSSYIKVIGTNINGISIIGTSGTPIRNIMLRDFSVISATPGSTNYGLTLFYTAFAIIERMQIQDFIIGVYMKGATNTQLDTIGATYTGSTNGFVGFNVYGGTSAADANSSSNLRRCYASGVSGLTGQIGFKMYGVYMSDCQFELCETAVTNYGFSFDYSSAPNYNVDVIVRNPIIDRYTAQGIIVSSLPSNGTLDIMGGYTNPDTTGAAATNIYLLNCAGVIKIEGHQFQALTNYAYTTGIYSQNSSNAVILGNSFQECLKGVVFNSEGYSTITGNVFNNAVHSATVFVQVTGGARIMVTGNSFNGYATTGVLIDNTSSGCGIVANTSNVTNIGTRYSNLGSSPIGGTDGSTGLNSGV